ncbi:MAG TPA: energy transducer TonB [Candidatus Sulfotelmatobacter sp.]
MAANENQAGIEALEYDKNIWGVELPTLSAIPEVTVASPSATQKKVERAKSRPRLSWALGLLLLSLMLGLSIYYVFSSSGRAMLLSPVPAVPSAQDLARLTPKPRPTPILAKTWDSSTPRVQVAESPTGHIVYPVAPDDSIKGRVRLEMVIAANGLVKQIHALSGNQTLAEAAAEAVRFWRYTPLPNNNVVAERETTVTVSFRGTDAVFLEFPSSNPQSNASVTR